MPRYRAITFIELLVVIIIIGILAGVSIPQFRKTFDNFELENFSKDIYYLTRYLQASAISQSKIHRLNIVPGQKLLQATYKEDQTGEFQKVEGKFGKPYKAPLSVTISNPTDTTDIYFYPDGSTSENKITFENKYERKVSVNIKGASGEIKIE